MTIYISICVCVCVCVLYVFQTRKFNRNRIETYIDANYFFEKIEEMLNSWIQEIRTGIRALGTGHYEMNGQERMEKNTTSGIERYLNIVNLYRSKICYYYSFQQLLS